MVGSSTLPRRTISARVTPTSCAGFFFPRGIRKNARDTRRDTQALSKSPFAPSFTPASVSARSAPTLAAGAMIGCRVVIGARAGTERLRGGVAWRGAGDNDGGGLRVAGFDGHASNDEQQLTRAGSGNRSAGSVVVGGGIRFAAVSNGKQQHTTGGQGAKLKRRGSDSCPLSPAKIKKGAENDGHELKDSSTVTDPSAVVSPCKCGAQTRLSALSRPQNRRMQIWHG